MTFYYKSKKQFFQTLLSFFTLVAFLGLTACSSKAPFSIAPGQTIMAFGDSLTEGYGASKNKDWPTVFSSLSGYPVVNSGISGNTTKDGLDRIEEALEENKPSLVILSLGGNDFIRQQSPSVAKENLKKIIQIIEKHNAHVVLVAQPAPSIAAAAFSSLSDHTLYKEIAKENPEVVVLSSFWADILSKGELKSDLIHANDKGYALFAQNLYDALVKAKILND